jgi:hypothetical protein
MSRATAGCLVLFGACMAAALPVGAQSPATSDPLAPPALLEITREEVRPGKNAAHAGNEAAWAAAYAKAGSPVHWLGMATVTGPNEAWFLSRHESFADFEKADASTDAAPALAAERDQLAATDGDLVSRTSTLLLRYREALSYQPEVRLPDMRYMTVDVVRVKHGKVAAFADGWRMIAAAHKTASMDEHWAVYQVVSGMPDTTFMFLYPRKSLAEIDASGPMHRADAYRNAVGDGGRRQMADVQENAIEMSQTLHFRLRPEMSTLPKEWAEADSYWTPPVPAPMPAKKGKK